MLAGVPTPQRRRRATLPPLSRQPLGRFRCCEVLQMRISLLYKRIEANKEIDGERESAKFVVGLRIFYRVL